MPVGPALDRARQPAGLALQVEAQRQRVQMLEHAHRHEPQRALLHLGEYPVADFFGRERDHAEDAVAEHDHDRHRDRGIRRHRQRIDHELVEDRHRHVRDLGHAHERERGQHAELEPAVGLRPKQCQHPPHDAHLVAPGELGIGLLVGRVRSVCLAWCSRADLKRARNRRSCHEIVLRIQGLYCVRQACSQRALSREKRCSRNRAGQARPTAQ